jgi:hypothetical protein
MKLWGGKNLNQSLILLGGAAAIHKNEHLEVTTIIEFLTAIAGTVFWPCILMLPGVLTYYTT